mgnify:FL=1
MPARQSYHPTRQALMDAARELLDLSLIHI